MEAKLKQKRIPVKIDDRGRRLIDTGEFLVLGVDPGKSGAIAILDNNYNLVDFTTIRGRIDNMISIVEEYSDRIATVFFEKNHARPTDGVASAFTFGIWTGMKMGVLRSMLLPITYLTPQQWMRIIGVKPRMTKKARKHAIKAKVIERVNLGDRKVPLLAFDAIGIATAGLDIILETN